MCFCQWVQDFAGLVMQHNQATDREKNLNRGLVRDKGHTHTIFPFLLIEYRLRSLKYSNKAGP